jgi:Co/Zn/Cd efflux system component
MATGLFAVALAPVRYFARDRRFAFWRWKIVILGGFAGAILVLGVVLLRDIRSIERILPFQTTRHGSRGQPCIFNP